MQIARDTADTLRRYFLNASPFLWGVLEARKKREKIFELKELGFLESHSENSTQGYAAINQKLLVEVGIDGVIDRIVAPIVHKRLGREVLKSLRRHWEQGQKPDIIYLKEHGLYPIHPIDLTTKEANREVPERNPVFIFLEINQQLSFVDHWTVFAGIWFEIIEPLITTADSRR